MIDALQQPLVAAYLRELDAALASLPPSMAAELAEQIRTHLLEALPPDADEGAVTAVLAALGPARLVAEAAADPVSGASPAAARRDPILRRLVTWTRRLTLAGRLTVAGIAVVIGLPAGALIYWQAQSGLQFMTTSAWWSQVDGAHDVTTEAAGASQDTVPIRPGEIQGFVITIYNPSDVTQVILSSADHVSPGAPGAPQIAVSNTGTIQQSGEPHWVSYRLDGGPIPPHSYRWVHVFWRSYHCYLNGAGSSQGTNELLLRVRVGWITRIEGVQLPTEFAVGATAATVKADHCGANPVPRP